MSTHTNSSDNPPIQPLHNSSLAAQVVSRKGLLVEKNKYASPTDNLITPCSRKLGDLRRKHYNKPIETVPLFPQTKNSELNKEEPVSEQVAAAGHPDEDEGWGLKFAPAMCPEHPIKMEEDDENPF